MCKASEKMVVMYKQKFISSCSSHVARRGSGGSGRPAGRPLSPRDRRVRGPCNVCPQKINDPEIVVALARLSIDVDSISLHLLLEIFGTKNFCWGSSSQRKNKGRRGPVGQHGDETFGDTSMRVEGRRARL